MNKIILFTIAFSFGAWLCQAQPSCTPDPLYADSAYGVWPDTVEDFPSACKGVYYETVLNFKIPSDGAPLGYPGTPVDSAKLDNVTGLPPGLTYVCNVGSCKWNGGQQGCGVIYGTPTLIGTYDITIEMTGYSHVFTTVIPIPMTFSNYRIIVCEAAVTISSSADTCNAGKGRAVANVAGCSSFSYQWSSGSTSSALTGLYAGSFNVTVTAGTGGCTAVSNISVENVTLAFDSFEIVNSTNCLANNGSATPVLSCGSVPLTYAWSNGQTGSAAGNLGAGTYVVSITDNNGYTAIAQVAITAPDALVLSNIIIQNESTGNDGAISFSVSGGVQPYTYQWSPPVSTDSSATGINGGTYSITITDANACSVVEIFYVIDAINENIYWNDFSVEPNPVQAELRVSFYSKNSLHAELNIFNILGKTVFSETFLTDLGYNMKILDFSGFPKGIYLFSISTNDKAASRKIIKVE